MYLRLRSIQQAVCCDKYRNVYRTLDICTCLRCVDLSFREIGKVCSAEGEVFMPMLIPPPPRRLSRVTRSRASKSASEPMYLGLGIA